MEYLCVPRSFWGHSVHLSQTCLKLATETAVRRVKRIEIWDSGIVAICIWVTVDFYCSVSLFGTSIIGCTGIKMASNSKTASHRMKRIEILVWDTGTTSMWYP